MSVDLGGLPPTWPWKFGIGPAHLVVKVAPSPLEADANGIDVLSHGLWHDTTLGDLPRQGAARRLFGEVSCDLLETWEGEPSPFDNTRNNTLNPANPVVATLLGWVSGNLRHIVARLEEEERERRKSEEARRLAREAVRLGRLLNEDFRELQRQLARIRHDQDRLSGAGLGLRTEPLIGPVARDDESATLLPGGGDLPTNLEQAGPPPGSGHRGSTGAQGDEDRPGSSLHPGEQPGAPHRPRSASTQAATFSIQFVNETAERERSHYDRETRTIFINLDHPQVSAARNISPDIESPGFRQVVYEIAFVEYALALMTEQAYRDPAIDAHEVLFDVRNTVNRVAARVPALLA